MNIYVSNLSYKTNDSNLKDLFTEFGEVSSAKIINDKFTGNSRGFGFVEMPNDDDAKRAIEELNNSVQDGKTITVNVAKERKTYSNNNSGYNNRY